MFRPINVGIAFAVIGVFMALPLEAQRPVDPPIAPFPGQLLSAKKVFISNASGTVIAPPGVSELTYNEFYAALKNWGAYELVSAPADADLILEIRYERTFGPVQFEALQLVIRDPRTQTVLWAFTREIQSANRQSTARKNFDVAMGQIVDDLKKLVAPPATAGDGTKK